VHRCEWYSKKNNLFIVSSVTRSLLIFPNDKTQKPICAVLSVMLLFEVKRFFFCCFKIKVNPCHPL